MRNERENLRKVLEEMVSKNQEEDNEETEVSSARDHDGY